MKIIQLEVQDSMLDEALNHIKQFVKTHKNSTYSLSSNTQSKQFIEDKLFFQQSLKDVENGKVQVVSHEDVWNSIDKHIQNS